MWEKKMNWKLLAILSALALTQKAGFAQLQDQKLTNIPTPLPTKQTLALLYLPMSSQDEKLRNNTPQGGGVGGPVGPFGPIGGPIHMPVPPGTFMNSMSANANCLARGVKITLPSGVSLTGEELKAVATAQSDLYID